MCENCAMCQFSYLGLLGNLYLPASNLQSDRWTTDETLACQYSPADTLKSYVVVVSAFDTWGINISKIAFLWAFHPILITWLLVVFAKEVYKILHNSLFTFLLCYETHGNENLATYFWYFGSFGYQSYQNT